MVELQGPEIGYASSDFSVTSPFTASTNSIDFSGGNTVTFNATFNEVVEYTITISASASGAEKVITGVGSELSEIWTGASNLIFFRTESVDVKLTILGVNGSQGEETIAITGTYVPEGIQLGNFEAGGTSAGCWFPGANQNSCNTGYVVTPKLEGTFAHQVGGTSLDKPGDQFVGLASIDPKIGFNNNGLHFAVPTTDPDQLYFNIYIYGKGDENVAMFIKFMQDDNSNGSHESDRENGFEMQLLDLSHTGWKRFSFKYSDVPLGGNTSFGGNGDGFYRPDKIRKIEFGLWAMDDPSQPVEFIYDYAAFTAGKPLGE